MNTKKDHPRLNPEEIRKRANAIWKRKCQALNTALDDWLQAERELRAQIGIEHKKPCQYTPEEITQIKKRAEAIHEEKIKSLRTAFDDWIEAEKELAEELKNKKINLHDLFDMWFSRVSPRVASMLDEDAVVQKSIFDEALGKEYVDLMTECMK
ncbi:MAG TPA: DUF2934 domain-containing protein [Candidatus Omnitrophota bacterium]|nr:DUF2934 domain-containing protein [Candidatus Omnitrophota bacterium]